MSRSSRTRIDKHSIQPRRISCPYQSLLFMQGFSLSSGWCLEPVPAGCGRRLASRWGVETTLSSSRRHGNFSEWVPVALILIAVLELNGVSSTALHAFGATLFLARIAHPLGLKPESTSGLPRALGAGATALVVLVAAVWAIATYF